LPNLNNRILTE